MRLKQIKLAGFKSFADPTTVTVPGSRCAVVGPNGCGKSNVIDAVRWVMGESSAKQMRGESATDVIFSGSNSRKSSAVASVELLFDNSDGRIGGAYAAYAEISIRRQVTRDVQSNYYLNGSRCRRRDILDIFLGTGFGPRSYSIIEQGMISQLVEAKPEELRVYLEEAAGISKYKERRRETENRIKHTRENLERINDIRTELGRALDRLQRQAQAAARYIELRDSENLFTAQLYTLRHLSLHGEVTLVESGIGSLEIEREKALAQQREMEANIEKLRQQHADSSEHFNTVQGRFYQLGSDIAKTEKTIQLNQSRVKQLELDLQTVEQRDAQTNEQLLLDQTQVAELEARLETLLPQVDVLANEDLVAREHLNAVEGEMQIWQREWDAFNSQFAGNDRDVDVQSSRIEHLEVLIARLKNREAELLKLQDEHEGFTDTAEMDQMAAEITDLEAQSREMSRQIDESLKNLSAAREDLLLRETQWEDARTDRENSQQALTSLQAVQEAALGQHVQEANAWIRAHDLTEHTRLAESLAVVPGWERAVETVLSHFLSALQVDSLDHFAASLAQLPEGDLALIEVGDSETVEVEHPAMALPSLNALVRADAVNAASLMHGIFAADSTAVALAERRHLLAGQSIITREGFWVGFDWVRVIHDYDHESGIIERGQRIDTLAMFVEEAEQTLQTMLNQVQAGRARIEQLEMQREIHQKNLNASNQSLGQRRTDHGVQRVKREEAQARRERNRKDHLDVVEQLLFENDNLSVARSRLIEAQGLREELEQTRKLLTARRASMDVTLAQARDAARQSRDQLYQLNVEKEGLNSRLVASETARDRLLAQQKELAVQLENLNSGITSSTAPLPDLEAELASQLATRVDLEKELGEIREQTEAASNHIRSLENHRQSYESNVEEIRTGLEAQRVKRQGLVVQQANVLAQIEATGHTMESVRDQMPQSATESAWVEELDRLGRQIQRLGAINLAAIEEFEQESERKVYLDAQADDLEEALDTLLVAIRKIDGETRTRFKGTFESVNSHLGVLFPKVFGGGHAYLELTGEDLLDTGVSLMARPPGKRNASVHLLSGGEKAMTAVALIFAIFHLNPSPVCLLDEVDAPLDDANVMRFAALIKEMSAEVQFLVITHNKITMEMADYLVGVTMQEPGVSRLVSVDVDEATAMAV